MLSVLCAELLNNPFKSWSFWEETKMHFYCIFFFYKSYMHCIFFLVTEWINHTKVPFWIFSTSSLVFISYELLNIIRTEHATFYNLLNSLEYYTDLCLRGLFFVCFFAWKYVWILKNVLPQSFAGFFPGGNGMQQIGMNGNCSAIGSCAHRHKIPFFCKNKNHRCVLKKRKK